MDAQKMKVILGKCKGGDVEIVDCFSMDYER
jgi:Ni,Fe-hydrogenase III small subunit